MLYSSPLACLHWLCELEVTTLSSSPCWNLKWKYRLDFAFHRIFTSETSMENVSYVSLYILTSRRWKCHFSTKCKAFDKDRMINVFNKTALPWFFNISNVHFSTTFTANHWWTGNRNEKCLKHMTSSTLVKCKSMIVSIVMHSYPNVTNCFFGMLLVNTELLLVL